MPQTKNSRRKRVETVADLSRTEPARDQVNSANVGQPLALRNVLAIPEYLHGERQPQGYRRQQEEYADAYNEREYNICP